MAQNFLQPGLDLSSLPSVTQAQLMQAMSQMAPITNIGFVIWQSVTPSVADNPLFARFLWADTSGGVANTILRYWDGATWVATSVAANSIVGSTSIIDGTITIAKMKGSEGFAGQVARVNNARDGLEYKDPEDLLSPNTVLPNVISTTGIADGWLLRVVDGIATWEDYNPVADVDNVPLSKLQDGNPNEFVIGKAVTGEAFYSKAPLTAIKDLANGADLLPVNKLDAGTNAGDMLRVAGGVLTVAVPTIDIFTTTQYTDVGIGTVGSAAQVEVAAAFTTNPKMWRVMLYCYADDATWKAGDEIDLTMLTNSGGNSLATAYYDEVDNKIKVARTVVDSVRSKTTGAITAFTLATGANWRFRARYIL